MRRITVDGAWLVGGLDGQGLVGRYGRPTFVLGRRANGQPMRRRSLLGRLLGGRFTAFTAWALRERFGRRIVSLVSRGAAAMARVGRGLKVGELARLCVGARLCHGRLGRLFRRSLGGWLRTRATARERTGVRIVLAV